MERSFTISLIHMAENTPRVLTLFSTVNATTRKEFMDNGLPHIIFLM